MVSPVAHEDELAQVGDRDGTLASGLLRRCHYRPAELVGGWVRCSPIEF